MRAIHSAQWQWEFTLRKTQEYLRNRIVGSGCERDQLEAWRHFYRTNDPIIRYLIGKHVLANVAERVEHVWLDVIGNLNTLGSPQTQDSFLYWLRNIVRSNVRERERSPGLLGDCAQQMNNHDDRSLNDQLLHLRLVELETVESIARKLGLTYQQVIERQRMLLKRILLVLIRFDILPSQNHES